MAVSALTDLVRRIARLEARSVDRADVPTLVWATVVTASPPTVLLEGDTSLVARGVSGNAAGPLLKGQRVRVEIQGQKIIVLASPVQNARGTVSITLSNAAGGTAAITYPAGAFTTAPNLQLTKGVAALARHIPYFTGNSATGATVGIYSGNDVAVTGTMIIHWLATP